jgi:formaldehyde-activating enzyme
MAKINKVMVGESLVGDGNEVAHIDLILGPRGSAVEQAFCNATTRTASRRFSPSWRRTCRPSPTR